MCELSLEKMGSIFADTNVYMLHMMYQAMGVCLYMQDWDGAMSYGEKIIQPYRYNRLEFRFYLQTPDLQKQVDFIFFFFFFLVFTTQLTL